MIKFDFLFNQYDLTHLYVGEIIIILLLSMRRLRILSLAVDVMLFRLTSPS